MTPTSISMTEISTMLGIITVLVSGIAWLVALQWKQRMDAAQVKADLAIKDAEVKRELAVHEAKHKAHEDICARRYEAIERALAAAIEAAETAQEVQAATHQEYKRISELRHTENIVRLTSQDAKLDKLLERREQARI